MQPAPWVSLDEIVQHVAVSQDTVDRWIDSRDMPAHKVGKLWKFRKAEVDRWVTSGKAGRSTALD